MALLTVFSEMLRSFGNPFYTGPRLTQDITAVIKIDVDELRTVGKLVISVQLFKIGH